MTSRKLKEWRLVHTWSSVVCTAFMFVLCLTGLPLVFRDELNDWVSPPPRVRSLAVETAPLPVDRLIEIAQVRWPKRFVEFVFWDHDNAHVLGLGLTDKRGAGLGNMTRELLDDRTGASLAGEPAEGGLCDFLADVHRSLCIGLVGDLWLGVMSIAFLVSLVSGVAVYLPLMQRVGFGVVRRARASRIVALDLHNLLGMVGLLWSLVVGVTGFINTLEAPLFAAWDANTMPTLLAPFEGKPPIARRGSVDAAVATAQAALPDMRVTSVGFPESPFGSPRHYLIWTSGRSLFTSRMFTPVLVDGETGALALARPFPWYLSMLELSRPLHFGDYGGLALKVVWALLDVALLVVLGTGLFLWIRGLRPPQIPLGY